MLRSFHCGCIVGIRTICKPTHFIPSWTAKRYQLLLQSKPPLYCNYFSTVKRMKPKTNTQHWLKAETVNQKAVFAPPKINYPIDMFNRKKTQTNLNPQTESGHLHSQVPKRDVALVFAWSHRVSCTPLDRITIMTTRFPLGAHALGKIPTSVRNLQ